MNGIVVENLENFALRFTQGAAHFLWIGVLLAVGVWVADRLLMRSAAARHGLHLVGMLLLALALPVCLVAVNVTGGPERKVSATPPNVVVEPEVATPAAPGVGVGEPRPLAVRDEAAVPAELPPIRLPNGEAVAEESIGVSAANGWLERSAPWVAGIYLVGLLVMMARLLAGLAGTRRLRRGGDPVESGLWVAGMQKMCATLGMKTKPVLAWSREVAAPVLIGIAKPVVLLPMALASRLTPRQLEAVLSHELAHLRRLDPWVVALQRVVETLLFFHPAVWWMSRRLERSREEACDDLVVAAGCDPADYAEALVCCSELRLKEAGLSGRLATQLSATGSGGAPLRRRVLRLLGQPERVPVRSGWILGAMALLAACLVWPIVLAAGPGDADGPKGDMGTIHLDGTGTKPTMQPKVVLPAGLAVAAEAKGPATQIESEVLRTELFNLCERMIAAQKETGQPMPGPAEVDARKKWMLDRCTKAVPGFLEVTPEQEKRYSDGKFDDRIAKERMRKTLRLLGGLDAELPVMCVFIAKEFDAGSLSGGQLEIANRVMLGPVHAMVQALQDDKAYPDAENLRNLLLELTRPRPSRTNPKDSLEQPNGLNLDLREGKKDDGPREKPGKSADEPLGLGPREIAQGAGSPEAFVMRGQMHGDLVVGRDLAVDLRGAAGDRGGILQIHAIRFEEKKKEHVKATLQGTLVSWPKGEWQVAVALLDGNGEILDEQRGTIVNSGLRPARSGVRIPAREEWDHTLDFGRVAQWSRKDKDFRVTLRGPDNPDIVWGETDKQLLALGLAYQNGVRPRKAGEEVVCSLFVRNESREEQTVGDTVPLLGHPAIIDATGRRIEVAQAIRDQPVQGRTIVLQPGETFLLGSVSFTLLAPGDETVNDVGDHPDGSCRLAPGVYRLVQDYRLSMRSGEKISDVNLRSGSLPLTVEGEASARSGGEESDVPPVESRQEKPFTTFSVELTSPELHDRTITFNGDGSYTFRLTELEKVPGKDYYRDSKDKYVARHGLASRDLRQLNNLLQETEWLAAPGKQDERLRDAVRYAMAVVHDGQNGQAVCYGNQERHYTDLVAFLQKVDRQEWWLYNLKKGERIFLYSLSSHLDEVVKKGVEPRVLDLGRLTEGVQTLSATGSQEQKAFARKVFEKLDKMTGQKKEEQK